MYRHREFRMVETERLTVSEWTSEGSLERLLQSALPEQSKECVWKEDSLWFGAARRGERSY